MNKLANSRKDAISSFDEVSIVSKKQPGKGLIVQESKTHGQAEANSVN